MSHMRHMKLILTFDIHANNYALRKRVWRMLKKINAKQKFRSNWELTYSEKNREKLREICFEIKKNGGEAELISGDKIA